MQCKQQYLKASKNCSLLHHPVVLLSFLPSLSILHFSLLWIMLRRSNPTGPPPPYSNPDSQTGVLISISEQEPGAMIASGSTATPRMRPRRRSVRMTTGGSFTRPSSTSTSPQASSMPFNSGRRSLPLLREVVVCLHPHSPTALIGVSHSQPLMMVRHQSPSSGLPQSTPQPPHLGLRTTMRPQTMGNPYNQPRTSTVAPLLQVVMLIDSSSFAQSFTTAYVSGNSVLRLVNRVVQVVLDPHM